MNRICDNCYRRPECKNYESIRWQEKLELKECEDFIAELYLKACIYCEHSLFQEDDWYCDIYGLRTDLFRQDCLEFTEVEGVHLVESN